MLRGKLRVGIPLIGITESSEEPAGPYIEAVEAAGGLPVLLSMEPSFGVYEAVGSLHGLLLTGGADIDPSSYGQRPDPDARLAVKPQRDAPELALLRAALGRDLPILAICRGMQALNVVLGGSLIQDLPNHRGPDDAPAFHQIFIPPGARMTGILGLCGFMKVNSMHHQGIQWAQKAPGLLVSAYSLKDGIIEAVESPDHRWVVGVQWHPERRGEVGRHHLNLFRDLVAAAAGNRDAA